MSVRKRRSAVRSACCKDGDIIAIDADKGTLDVKLAPQELAERRKNWKARPIPTRAARCASTQTRSGRRVKGAVTHAGGKAEVVCYADI